MAERGSFIPVRATQATIGGAPFELGDNLPGTNVPIIAIGMVTGALAGRVTSIDSPAPLVALLPDGLPDGEEKIGVPYSDLGGLKFRLIELAGPPLERRNIISSALPQSVFREARRSGTSPWKQVIARV